MSRHLNLVSYFGGKYPHLTWLTGLFPQGNYHFVDLMCGSANVALNVDYPLITINDLNDNVINLFEVLRNNQEKFIEAVYYTPFSRAELYKFLDKPQPKNKIEWARQYFVKCQLGYGANGSQNNHKGAGFEYKIQRSNHYRVDAWNNKLAKLPLIAEKLRSMQIENRDCLELLSKLDNKETVIYIDPPYLLSTRKSKKRYIHEQNNDFHVQLLTAAHAMKNAKIVISGYDNPMYDELLPGWIKTIGPTSKATVSKKEIKECVWSNYDPATINNYSIKNKQVDLFELIDELETA